MRNEPMKSRRILRNFATCTGNPGIGGSRNLCLNKRTHFHSVHISSFLAGNQHFGIQRDLLFRIFDIFCFGPFWGRSNQYQEINLGGNGAGSFDRDCGHFRSLSYGMRITMSCSNPPSPTLAPSLAQRPAFPLSLGRLVVSRLGMSHFSCLRDMDISTDVVLVLFCCS